MHTYQNKFKIKKCTFIHILFFLLFLLVFFQWSNILSDYVLGKDFISEKKFGGEQTDISAKIIFTEENYFLIVGETNSKGAGNSDAWIVKLDEQGELLWDKTFGGKENDGAYSIVESKDGGYVICGYTWSKGNGRDDGWVFKIDKNGKVLWDKTFGASGSDRLNNIIKADGEGYVAVGFADREHCALCSEQGYIWVIKISDTGNLIWENKNGGSTYDIGNDIIGYEEGYLVVARSNKSSETSFASLIEIDYQGMTKTEISLVREKDGYFNSITKTSEDDFFLIVGDTWFESTGSSDLWVIKFGIK